MSPDYGEIYAKTDYTFGEDDKFTLRGLILLLPTTTKAASPAPGSQGWRVKLWKKVGLYAGAGYQFFEDPNAFE